MFLFLQTFSCLSAIIRFVNRKYSIFLSRFLNFRSTGRFGQRRCTNRSSDCFGNFWPTAESTQTFPLLSIAITADLSIIAGCANRRRQRAIQLDKQLNNLSNRRGMPGDVPGDLRKNTGDCFRANICLRSVWTPVEDVHLAGSVWQCCWRWLRLLDNGHLWCRLLNF